MNYVLPYVWFEDVCSDLIRHCHASTPTRSLKRLTDSIRKAVSTPYDEAVLDRGNLAAMLQTPSEDLSRLLLADAVALANSNDAVASLWTEAFAKCEAFCARIREHAEAEALSIHATAARIREHVPQTRSDIALECRFMHAHAGVGPEMDSTCIANMQACSALLDDDADADLRRDVQECCASLLRSKVGSTVVERILDEEVDAFVKRIEANASKVMEGIRAQTLSYCVAKHAPLKATSDEISERLQRLIFEKRRDDPRAIDQRAERMLARFKVNSNIRTVRDACMRMQAGIARACGITIGDVGGTEPYGMLLRNMREHEGGSRRKKPKLRSVGALHKRRYPAPREVSPTGSGGGGGVEVPVTDVVELSDAILHKDGDQPVEGEAEEEEGVRVAAAPAPAEEEEDEGVRDAAPAEGQKQKHEQPKKKPEKKPKKAPAKSGKGTQKGKAAKATAAKAKAQQTPAPAAVEEEGESATTVMTAVKATPALKATAAASKSSSSSSVAASSKASSSSSAPPTRRSARSGRAPVAYWIVQHGDNDDDPSPSSSSSSSDAHVNDIDEAAASAPAPAPASASASAGAAAGSKRRRGASKQVSPEEKKAEELEDDYPLKKKTATAPSEVSA